MGKKKLSRDFFYMGETESWVVYVNKKTNEVYRAPVKFKGTMEVAGKSSLYAVIGILLTNIFGVSFTSFLSTQELQFANQNIIYLTIYFVLCLLNAFLFWKLDNFNKYKNITKISKAEKRDFISAVNKNVFIKFGFDTPYYQAMIRVIFEELLFLIIVIVCVTSPFYVIFGITKLSVKEIFESYILTWGFAAVVLLIFRTNPMKCLKYVKYFNEGKLHFIDD